MFFGSQKPNEISAKILKRSKGVVEEPPTKTVIYGQVVSTTSVGKRIDQQCSLGGMEEFVVLYGIVGIIRMERSSPGLKKKPM